MFRLSAGLDTDNGSNIIWLFLYSTGNNNSTSEWFWFLLQFWCILIEFDGTFAASLHLSPNLISLNLAQKISCFQAESDSLIGWKPGWCKFMWLHGVSDAKCNGLKFLVRQSHVLGVKRQCRDFYMNWIQQILPDQYSSYINDYLRWGMEYYCNFLTFCYFSKLS